MSVLTGDNPFADWKNKIIQESKGDEHKEDMKYLQHVDHWPPELYHGDEETGLGPGVSSDWHDTQVDHYDHTNFWKQIERYTQKDSFHHQHHYTHQHHSGMLADQGFSESAKAHTAASDAHLKAHDHLNDLYDGDTDLDDMSESELNKHAKRATKLQSKANELSRQAMETEYGERVDHHKQRAEYHEKKMDYHFNISNTMEADGTAETNPDLYNAHNDAADEHYSAQSHHIDSTQDEDGDDLAPYQGYPADIYRLHKNHHQGEYLTKTADSASKIASNLEKGMEKSNVRIKTERHMDDVEHLKSIDSFDEDFGKPSEELHNTNYHEFSVDELKNQREKYIRAAGHHNIRDVHEHHSGMLADQGFSEASEAHAKAAEAHGLVHSSQQELYHGDHEDMEDIKDEYGDFDHDDLPDSWWKSRAKELSKYQKDADSLSRKAMKTEYSERANHHKENMSFHKDKMKYHQNKMSEMEKNGTHKTNKKLYKAHENARDSNENASDAAMAEHKQLKEISVSDQSSNLYNLHHNHLMARNVYDQARQASEKAEKPEKPKDRGNYSSPTNRNDYK